ncbi:MAG: DsbA family protein [Balneolales bacterium]|nr:DsbA family protein [Balneolales bacterium]
MKKTVHFFLFSIILLSTTFCQKAESTNTNTSEPVSSVAVDQVSPEITAKVTVVKYSDYQCPACAHYYSYVKQLKQDFGDDVHVVTKHFPLNQHPYAQVASRAAEASKKQGKYNEFHELIFAGQQQWSQGNAEAIFIGYARSLDMDIDMFTADMNSADMNRIVVADRREGIEMGVNSTPTFFINGNKIENQNSYEEFKTIVESYMD